MRRDVRLVSAAHTIPLVRELQMSIKAMLLPPGGGLDKLAPSVVESRAPGPGAITVRVHACSLNYHDYVVVSGGWPLTTPRIPLSDAAGVVTAVGDGVEDFAVGDSVVSLFFPDWHDGPPGPGQGNFARVPGDGIEGYAREEVTAPASAFTKPPCGYSHVEAATLPCAALTAWRALVVEGNIKPGDTVLVQGSGGVSVFALQFAKMAGATVIATSSSDKKLQRLKSFGADHLINYRSTPAWGAEVRRLTGHGVDHVVEVGGPGTMEQSLMAARVGGHIALIGILTGLAGEVSFIQALAKHLRIQGMIVGNRRHQLEMIRAIETSGIRPVIDRTFPLDELADGFRHQAAGRHVGKICVEL
jgi:NADPH:quinone reductase-like Zn-dependent oxidoreductase